jgi:hypothetical protein
MNDALKADHGEQSTGYGGARNEGEDDDPQQATSAATRGLLEELVALSCGSDHGWSGIAKRKGWKKGMEGESRRVTVFTSVDLRVAWG